MQTSIIPTLCEYVKIPNQSPAYDKEFMTNGLNDSTFVSCVRALVWCLTVCCAEAIDLLVNWVRKQNIEGLHLEVLRPEGHTPLIFIVVDASAPSSE